jgi:hypothetical protein
VAPRRRPLLSSEQLRALDDALLAAYRQHEELCAAHPVARGRISRPGIPSAFSESLAAIVLPAVSAGIVGVEFGGRQADLIAITSAGFQLTIEVKASGVSSWQELKDRDLAADGLLWIDFARRYVDGTGPITAHYLPQPARYTLPRRKLTLELYLSGASELDGFVSRTFGTLADAIRVNASTAACRAQLRLGYEL